MKIIICLHHFLPDVLGGTEMYTFHLASHLQKMGVAVAILIPHFDETISDEYFYKNIRVIRYAENSVQNRKMILGQTKPEGMSAFINIIKREQPDIVHFHELAPGRGINIFHVAEVHKCKFPIVTTFHVSYYSCMKGTLIYKDKEKCDGIINIKKCTKCIYDSKKITGAKMKFLSNAGRALFKIGVNTSRLNNKVGTAIGYPFVIDKIKNDLLKLSKLSEKIIVVADWYKQVLVKNKISADKIIYIQQGFENYVQALRENKSFEYPLKIVFVGRISRLKGLHLLIEAVTQLPKEKIALFIYGPEAAGEIDYVNECKLKSGDNSNIYWKGVIAHQQVVSTISAYHLLCLPSLFSEMSPLVIQEAFAAGLPVIASDVYGNAAQISEGINGWLFRFNDSNHLSKILKLLIEDKSMLENAVKHLPAAYLFNDVATEHFKMYSSILAQQ